MRTARKIRYRLEWLGLKVATKFVPLPKGGHFAAWEQPELLTNEMRAAFKSLRSSETKQ